MPISENSRARDILTLNPIRVPRQNGDGESKTESKENDNMDFDGSDDDDDDTDEEDDGQLERGYNTTPSLMTNLRTQLENHATGNETQTAEDTARDI